MQATKDTERPAVGDVIVVGGHHVGDDPEHGRDPRGARRLDHERYRVRWEDGHESIFHPADGEATIHHYAPQGASVELIRRLKKLESSSSPFDTPARRPLETRRRHCTRPLIGSGRRSSCTPPKAGHEW